MNYQNAEEVYADILNLPHHELTTRQRMPVGNRAASFAPFAALTGYDESVKEAARLTKERIELDEGTKEVLNDKLNLAVEKADEQPEISITYFLPDKRKSGGEYVTVKAVSKWERDISFPDTATIPKLAEILEVSVEELMSAKTVPVSKHKGARHIVNIILKAIPVAMGVAVIVTSLLGELDMKSGFTMLGIGLACIGVYLLNSKE